MIKRDSFIFYRSFYEALLGMDKESQADSLMALAKYALDGEDSELKPESRMFFILAKPQIDANQKKFENGSKGGRPKKPKDNLNITETKPKDNLNITKPEPNVNDNVNVNVNDNVNDNENIIIKENKKEKKYRFEGKIIKLTDKDFNHWEKAFPDLNLYAELLVRDDFLSTRPIDEQKKWYVSTSAYFIKENERRKKQHEENEKTYVF